MVRWYLRFGLSPTVTWKNSWQSGASMLTTSASFGGCSASAFASRGGTPVPAPCREPLVGGRALRQGVWVAGGRVSKVSDSEISVIGALALMTCSAISWDRVSSVPAQTAGRLDTIFRR